MKPTMILALLVFGVVQMFATAEAKFMFDILNEKAALKASEVVHMRTSVEEFSAASDSKPVGHPNCSCAGEGLALYCICSGYVNNQTSDLSGNFTLTLCSIWDRFYVDLYMNEDNILSQEAGILDPFLYFACNESEITKGKAVCFFVDGLWSIKPLKVIGDAYLLISDATLLTIDLGSYSFDYPFDNAVDGMKASKLGAAGFPELYETEEKILLIKERILMKKNFPGMDDEMM